MPVLPAWFRNSHLPYGLNTYLGLLVVTPLSSRTVYAPPHLRGGQAAWGWTVYALPHLRGGQCKAEWAEALKIKQKRNRIKTQNQNNIMASPFFMSFLVVYGFVFVCFSILINIIIKNVCDVSYFHLVLLFGFLLIIIISFKYPILGYSHNYIKESKQRKAWKNRNLKFIQMPTQYNCV